MKGDAGHTQTPFPLSSPLTLYSEALERAVYVRVSKVSPPYYRGATKAHSSRLPRLHGRTAATLAAAARCLLRGRCSPRTRLRAATRAATAAFAGMMAHAAIVFAGEASLSAYSANMLQAAEAAWQWLEANPGYSYYGNSGFFSANPEVDEYSQDAYKLTAASYLFSATDDSDYQVYFDANYTNMHAMQWSYWYT